MIERRLRCASLAVLALLLLGGCSERPQTARAASNKADGKAWQEAGSAFNAPGYQGGDAARWEQQLRTRAQAQNDYAAAR